MLRLVIIPVLISMGGAVIIISAVTSLARQQAYPESWLLYDVRQTDSFEIYRMNPDDRTSSSLSTGSFHFYPIGSPNGAWLAFWGWNKQRWNLYRMRVDGSEPRIILADQRNLMNHSWTRDGATVRTYTPARGLTRDSYIRMDDYTVPAPDGEWLVIFSRRNPAGLYRTRADRSEFELLVADDYILDFTLTWSPDSQWISYVSRRNRETAIYRVRLDGSKTERLTQENLPYRRLSWMPSANLPFHLLFLLAPALCLITSSMTLLRWLQPRH